MDKKGFAIAVLVGLLFIVLTPLLMLPEHPRQEEPQSQELINDTTHWIIQDMIIDSL